MPLDAKALADATADIVTRHIAQATAPLLKRVEELEARPVPVDGKDGRDGTDGVNGKDGAGIVDVMRNHEGVLVFTLSDGRIKEVGNVNGKDGRDGVDGKDGEAGAPGKDGFSLSDFDANVSDDGRTILLSFEQESERFEVEMKFPVPIYRGVFKEGEEYEAGDMATWGGSLWHCDEKTTDKPDVGPWRLCVKKGRDGKDAKHG